MRFLGVQGSTFLFFFSPFTYGCMFRIKMFVWDFLFSSGGETVGVGVVAGEADGNRGFKRSRIRKGRGPGAVRMTMRDHG